MVYKKSNTSNTINELENELYEIEEFEEIEEIEEEEISQTQITAGKIQASAGRLENILHYLFEKTPNLPENAFESEWFNGYKELETFLELVREIIGGECTMVDYRLNKIAEQEIIMAYFLKLSAIAELPFGQLDLLWNINDTAVKALFKPLKRINQALRLTKIDANDKTAPTLVERHLTNDKDNVNQLFVNILGWSPNQPLTETAPTPKANASDIIQMDIWIAHIIEDITNLTNEYR